MPDEPEVILETPETPEPTPELEGAAPETPAPEEPEAPEAEVEAKPEESLEEPAPEPAKKPGIQKRFDELTRQREDAKREADYWKQVALGKKPDEPQPEQTLKVVAPAKPTINQFETYDEYVEAVAEWKADLRIEQREQKRQAEETKIRAKEEEGKILANFNAQAKEAKKKYDDWDEVATSTLVPYSPHMSRAVLSSEMGADIAYYLGQNLDVAERLAKLSPLDVVREIGRLEERISLGSKITTKKVSNAPPPISTVKGKSVATLDAESMDMEAYKKARISGQLV